MKKESGFIGGGKHLSFPIRLGIAIIVDVVDFVYGILGSIFGIPGLSIGPTIYDVGQTGVSLWLTGKIGWVAGWEVLAVTDIGNILDSFVPTVSILVVYDELSRPDCSLGGVCMARKGGKK